MLLATMDRVPRIRLRCLGIAATLAVAAGISTDAVARYRPLTFRELSTRAELVVLGTIVSTAGDTFVFNVDRTVRARPSARSLAAVQRIEITKFRNWTCARRWTEYAAGQRAILFIERRSGNWFVLGGGNEGEMTVEGEWAFVDGNIAGDFDQWTVYGVPRLVGRVPLERLLRAIERGTAIPRSQTADRVINAP